MSSPLAPRRLRASALSVTLAAALLACQSTAPTPAPTASSTPAPSGSPDGSASPAPSQDLAATYADIEEAVRRIRELEEQQPVEPTVIGEAELIEYVQESFSEDNPPEYVASYERLLKRMGLVPEDEDLGELFIELLGSQVAGLYDPDDKALYVVSRSGQVGVSELVTYAHEYQHALQDQAFGLLDIAPVQLDEGDRAIARNALIEGDATLVMTYWAQSTLTQEQLVELGEESSDPEQTAILERMPAILREPLLFPYTGGLNHVLGLQLSGGWAAVDAAFAEPPESTEQILHPDKIDEAPIDVTFPADLATNLGAGWSEVLQDTFGEFQLGIWLREPGGLGAIAAGEAAAGWGGDRLVLLEGPNDSWAVVVDTAWDTAADADEFRQGALGIAQALQADGASADVLDRDETSATVLIASSPEVLGQVANVLGLAG